MTPWRGVTLVVLAFIVLGFVVQAVSGPGAAPGATPAATPAPTAVPRTETAAGEPVRRALAAIQRAFNAGDVATLCRPSALVDPAVIRQQNSFPSGCEGELEELVANEPPLRLTVHQLALKPGVATAMVTTRNGTEITVDFIHDGRRWLLSFSGGGDPMPALADAD
jgi:hypothetical protein